MQATPAASADRWARVGAAATLSLLVLACLVLAPHAPARAQDPAPAPTTAPLPQTSSEPPAGISVTPPAGPSPALVVALVRSTLIALQHANATGNYTVLRDLGSPEFQAANNSARLGQVFASLRDNRVDLSDALIRAPELMLQPNLDPTGRLRIVGFIPSDTQRIHFDLLFQATGGNWQIFGINIKPVAVPKKPAEPQGGSALKPVIPEVKK